MKNKLPIIIVLAGVGLAAILSWPWGPSEPGKNQSAAILEATTISADHDFYDFGTISMAGGNVSHTFEIGNNGAGEVEINKVYTSCMCTAASLVFDGYRKGPFGMPGHGFAPRLGEKVKPGQTIKVEVVFDPTAHGPAGIGPVNRAVYIEQNGKLPLELKFTALVTP